MSMGSPQAPISSSIAITPLPIQAVADSTTKPRNRKRSRKKERPQQITVPSPLEQVLGIQKVGYQHFGVSNFTVNPSC